MKIVVTGAAGAIGSNLAERLLEEGHEVIGIDALTPYYDPRIKRSTGEALEKAGVKMHYKNLLDEDTLLLLKDAQIVFHLAGQPGISLEATFDDYLNNNIVVTEKMMETLKSNSNLEAFINASTSSVYGVHANDTENAAPKPTSWYGATKLAAEQLALSYYRDIGLPVINFRFFSVYGERERPDKFFFKLIRAMHEDKEITLYEGSENHVRSYTYISDIIDPCIQAMERRKSILGETFNLGNDKTNTTGEGLRFVEEIMGKKAKIKVMPKRSGDQLETSAQINKARTLLNYNPKTDLKTGLAKEIKWYSEFVHNKF